MVVCVFRHQASDNNMLVYRCHFAYRMLIQGRVLINKVDLNKFKVSIVPSYAMLSNHFKD